MTFYTTQPQRNLTGPSPHRIHVDGDDACTSRMNLTDILDVFLVHDLPLRAFGSGRKDSDERRIVRACIALCVLTTKLYMCTTYST